MGLAASQCRLLFITSRQTDVSYKMQRLSNSLLTLARDDEDIATEYNKRLNATKMVPTSDFMDLSYSAMMGDNAMATGNPKFINERLSNGQVGRVVLADGEYSKLGLSTSSGKPGDIKSQTGCATSTAYAAKMAGVSESEAAGYINKASGANSTTSSTATADAKSVGDDFIKTYGNYTFDKKKSYNSINDYIKSGKGTVDFSDFGLGKEERDIIGNTLVSLDSLQGKTLEQIMNGDNNGDYCANISTKYGGNDIDRTESKENLTKIANSLVSTMEEFFDSSVINEIKSYIDIIVTGQSFAPYSNYKEDDDWAGGNSKDTITKGLQNDVANDLRSSDNSDASVGLIGATHVEAHRTGSDLNTTVLNISELARRLFAYGVSVANVVGGDLDKDAYTDTNNRDKTKNNVNSTKYLFDDSSNKYQINEMVNSKGYTKEQYEYNLEKVCKNEAQSGNDVSFDEVLEYIKSKAPASVSNDKTAAATPESKVQYYAKMFDELNAYGWTAGGTGENIIANVKNDNYLYNHGVFSNSVEYMQVDDEETQKGAEAWYNTETKKIKRKEKEIEMQQTQLQSEYTALNTEIESVKSIISKNIERSFQYCNA